MALAVAICLLTLPSPLIHFQKQKHVLTPLKTSSAPAFSIRHLPFTKSLEELSKHIVSKSSLPNFPLNTLHLDFHLHYSTEAALVKVANDLDVA